MYNKAELKRKRKKQKQRVLTKHNKPKKKTLMHTQGATT